MSEQEPEARLWEMMSAHYYSRGLYCAALLKLPDHLKDGPRTAAELAARCECNPRVLYRLLRALTTVELFEQNGDKFSLTPMSDLLRSDVPRTQRAKALIMGGDWDNWGELPTVLKTGEKRFKEPVESLYGDSYKGTDEDAAIFDQAMDAFYYDAPVPMLGVYDFNDAMTVCDVAGGSGKQLVALLKAYPNMRGILFDLPETIESRSKEYIEAEGLTERCQCVGGDFFKAIPHGADLYLLRHVIHNWDDEKAIAILRNVAEVLPENGKVLVIDWVIPPDDPKAFSKWWDLMNLLFSGGAERTPEEHAGLFTQAGLEFTRYLPAKLDTGIIEGIKAR